MKPPHLTQLATTVTAAACVLTVALPAQASPQRPSDLADRSTRQQTQQTRQVAIEAARSARDGKQKLTPPGRSTPVTAALDATLAQLVRDGAIGTTARVQTRTFTWSGAAGLRELGKGAPAGRQDRFLAASNTKVMVATLVLQEVQKGTWRLDQRVDEIIPGLFPQHPDVTFRQLLSHTSGIPNGTNELIASQLTPTSTEADVIAAISRDYTPQQHLAVANAGVWTTPGQFVYSNVGYIALGVLLEAQNRRSLPDLLRERVFRPAGMAHTSFATDPIRRGPVLQEDAWQGPQDGWLELQTFDPDLFWAAGAVVTTAADLTAFTRALIGGRLISRALVDQMATPVAPGGPYGLGLYRIADPCPKPGAAPYFYGHDGASFGTTSIAFTSADGSRSFTAAATGRDVSAVPGRWEITSLVAPLSQATCGR